jgi:hypothetical protein
MKNVLVISTHSFVDLITNSSSELFVCDGKKTLEAVDILLRKLLDQFNGNVGRQCVFNDVFKPIKTSKYTFEYWNVPKDIRENYEHFHKDAFDPYSFDTWNPDGDKNTEKKELEAKETEIRRKWNYNEKDLAETNKDEYDRRWKGCNKERDALWTDYGARKLKSELLLFIEFLKQNNATKKQIALAKTICTNSVKHHLEHKAGEYGHTRLSLKHKLAKLYDFFNFLERWGITIKKGDILIYSKDDNSIPYELMGVIESYLSFKRYHLG